jgi:hypothetical protein
MALGAGLAGAPTLGAGISRGLSLGLHGAQLDRQQQNINLTAKALQSRVPGMDAQTALAVASNPTMMQAIIPSLFGTRKGEVINNRLVDPTNGRVIADFSDTARLGPETKTIKDAAGNDMLVQWDPQSKQWQKVPGFDSTPTNPFSYGKQTEAQAKESGYANRMFEAEKILRDPAIVSAGTSQWERLKNTLAPGADAKNLIASPEFQRLDQAQRDFVNAILRRESGAAISAGEFDNARRQYFPQVGDSPEVLAQKKANREAAIAGVAGGAGPSYAPPFQFGANGELVPTGAGRQGRQPAGMAPPTAGTAPPPGAYIYDPAVGLVPRQ